MSEEKTLFLPLTILKWKAIKIGKGNNPVSMAGTKSIGFVPAFESLEDLRKEFPDAGYTVCTGEPSEGPSE